MFTDTEIHFLPVDESHTHALSRETMQALETRWLGLLIQMAFFRHFKTTRMSVWPMRGINQTAWGDKLVLMADLAYPMSCPSLGHLLMAQHCYLCLNVRFSLPTAPTPPTTSRPIDSIHDITAVEKTSSKTR